MWLVYIVIYTSHGSSPALRARYAPAEVYPCKSMLHCIGVSESWRYMCYILSFVSLVMSLPLPSISGQGTCFALPLFVHKGGLYSVTEASSEANSVEHYRVTYLYIVQMIQHIFLWGWLPCNLCSVMLLEFPSRLWPLSTVVITICGVMTAGHSCFLCHNIILYFEHMSSMYVYCHM